MAKRNDSILATSLIFMHHKLMRARSKLVSSSLSSEGKDKEDVTHLLILRFQEMLSEGLLSPGAKLPSERDLANHFGVARSSLRQALKVLEIMGVLRQKVGDGSYLNEDASSVLAVPMEFLFLLDDISWQELMEIRLMTEPALAAKAAEHANSADIALLKQSLEDFEQSRGDHLKMVASDLLFHRAIFQASGNRLSGRLFHMIHRAMLNMMMLTSQMVELEHTLAFHKPIFMAIKQRDSALAQKLMSEHLNDANRLLEKGRQRQAEHTLQEHFRTTTTATSVKVRQGKRRSTVSA
jgi:GntR family transcriptional repressor for pyruvate dehydrogenase complex